MTSLSKKQNNFTNRIDKNEGERVVYRLSWWKWVDHILHCDFYGFWTHYLVCGEYSGDNDMINNDQSITLHNDYNHVEQTEMDVLYLLYNIVIQVSRFDQYLGQ